MMVARLTMCCRSSSDIPLVIVKNTGMVPNGLVNVKKEVKHSNAYGKSVSMSVIFMWLYGTFAMDKFNLS